MPPSMTRQLGVGQQNHDNMSQNVMNVCSNIPVQQYFFNLGMYRKGAEVTSFLHVLEG